MNSGKKEKIRDEEADRFKQQLSKRFETLRDDLGYSQQEMADEIGVTQNAIFRLENDCKVSFSSLASIFLYFYKNHKVSPEWLFTPNNTDITKYTNDLKIGKKKRDAEESRKLGIVDEMIAKLMEAKLMPPSSSEDNK